MNCERMEDSDLTARYVSGQLDAPEREAFEEHFFQCSQCFEDVQLQLATRDQLAVRKVPLRKSAAPRMALWVGIAALVVLAVAISWTRRTPPAAAVVTQPAPDPLVLLARVDPPAYRAPALRGAVQQDARFSGAMEKYVAKDYSSAIEGLKAANPKSPDAQFFLGVCYLLQGNAADAIRHFTKTIQLGDSLDLEPAHFYLAKAYLQSRDVPSAIRELESAIALRGDLEPQSRALLDQLKQLPR